MLTAEEAMERLALIAPERWGPPPTDEELLRDVLRVRGPAL